MACVKKNKTNQKSVLRKTRGNQTKQKKPQEQKTRTKQAVKNTVSNPRKTNCPIKYCQFTKKARKVLSSCMEDLCQEVYLEANRMRKKIKEPTISHQVLLAALEQSMAKESVLRTLTEQAMKKDKKKEMPVNTNQKASRPAEKQAAPKVAPKSTPKSAPKAAPTKMLHKSRKASPVFHQCS